MVRRGAEVQSCRPRRRLVQKLAPWPPPPGADAAAAAELAKPPNIRSCPHVSIARLVAAVGGAGRCTRKIVYCAPLPLLQLQ